MATVKPPNDPESNPKLKAVFDDIRLTRNTESIGNTWRLLAFDPTLPERTWHDVKTLMGAIP